MKLSKYDCTICKGSGEITINGSDGDYEAQCYACGGSGKVSKQITLEEYDKLKQEIAQKDEALEQAREAIKAFTGPYMIKDNGIELMRNALTAIDKALGGNGDE